MERFGPMAAGAWLQHAGTRGWFFGAGISLLLWTWPTFSTVWSDPSTALGHKLLITGLSLVFFVVYAFGPPYAWFRENEPHQLRAGYLVLAALLLSNLLVVAVLGAPAVWTWTFLACSQAMLPIPARWRFAVLIMLSAGAMAIGFSVSQPEVGVIQGSVVLSIGLMLMAFARQIELRQQLEATRQDLADAAVAAERDRMARDMHDILGHSLTVVAVKAELARRLLDADPDRSRKELEEIEELTRGALADVRATVAGYRGVNVVAELAQARAALGSAGIEAELPGTVDQVSSAHRELFGWVVREGVTNVVRHSRAAHCRITLTADRVQVDDDGGWRAAVVDGRQVAGGAVPQWIGKGTGLDGLAERVRLAGGTMTTGPSELGGFRLTAVMGQ
ncbi:MULTISPECIES: sensor histidine kinase [Arthrobacter]|uniref:Sensor histidine kinase n=2 Tax=Arthrobacter TaxID=1663 RepID=A0ABU9KQ76_9MICC|nr:sensor histidine kinase [Arthrobacter sp. YJM1]MDP5228264.1 sensor histidine kinase [Arthrobacter sp. YJM1]